MHVCKSPSCSKSSSSPASAEQQKVKKEKDNKKRRTAIKEFEDKWIGPPEKRQKLCQTLLLHRETPQKTSKADLAIIRKFEKHVDEAEESLIRLRNYAHKYHHLLSERVKNVRTSLEVSHQCYRELSKTEYIRQADETDSDYEDGLVTPFSVARQDENETDAKNWKLPSLEASSS